MRSKIFALRNLKELLRDPLSLLFGIGLPVVLLILMSIIQKSTSVPIFELERFTPGIAMFSFSFITLFSAQLIAKDRNSAFLTRMFSSPLKAKDYIIGYSLPLIPVALLQVIICFITAIILGLKVSIDILITIILLIPSALLFIALGLLLGSVLDDNKTAPISSIIIQVTALSSGLWFDINMIGGTLKIISCSLPFYHSLELSKMALLNNYSNIFINLSIVSLYTLVIFILSIKIFKNKMTS